MRRGTLARLLALLLALAPRAARADVTQFASFDLERQEQDDENMLDVFLARLPDAWRRDWEQAPGGFRSSQGCLTAGQWYLVHELKTRAALGDTARFEVSLLQVHDHESIHESLHLDARFPTRRFGVLGLRFRPDFDKSQQDFALLWDLGGPTRAHELQLTFTFEDLFNSFWEFRQSQVGGESQPYVRHPFEPALRHVWRGAHHRLETNARWLTPLEQQRFDAAGALVQSHTLWGAEAGSQLLLHAGPWSGELALDGKQARSTDLVLGTPLDGRVFRRRWAVEAALRREFSRTWSGELRWIHREREQSWRPPAGEGRFHAVDRMPVIEAAWQAHPDARFRFGVMRGDIDVTGADSGPASGYGTRLENRAFVGLQVRFGRLVVQGIEGIELDAEPYEVSFHHDKGFIQLQTTF